MPYLIPTLRRRRLAAAGLSVWLGLAAGPVVAAATPTTPDGDPVAVVEAREAAVRTAQQGDIAQALATLQRLQTRHPQSLAVRLDLAVVAAWAGDDARAVDLLTGLEPATLPTYVLEALAKANRNLRRWDQALDLYSHLLEREPGALEFRLARILVLADDDRTGLAEAELQAARQSADHDATAQAELEFACGYVAERARRFTRALTCYRQALAHDPQHREARHRYVLAASGIGASRPALDAALARPGLVSHAELLRLRLDAAAQRVRWSGIADPAGPRGHAEAALAAHASLRREPELAVADSPRARALAFDHVAALAAAGRPEAAVQAFEALDVTSPASIADGTETLPVYLLSVTADAYLRLRQPEPARDLYRAALRQAPDRFDLLRGLFYACSDLHDYACARSVTERLAAVEPAWASRQRGNWQPNPRYAQTRELAALELAFRGRYRESLSDLDALLDIAPANTGLRLSRANVRRWRGWPAAAASDVRHVQALAPDNLQAGVLAAELDIDQRRYPEAEGALAGLTARDPEAAATRDLIEHWQLHDSPEVALSAGAGRASGGTVASREWQAEGHYFTRPLAYRYRLFVHDRAAFGRFDEGNGRRHRLGAGVELRQRHARWRAEVNRGLADTRSTGAAAAVDWFAGDRLSLSAEAEIESAQVPLRGARIGTTGDSASVSGRYRWHESRQASAAVGALDLSDGNLRRWLRADFEQRLVNLPRHHLTGAVRAFASRNSETGRVYFNPESDRELALGLTHEWRILRRYDHGLTQRLSVEAGDYRQQGFGSGTVWSASVEHEWLLGPRTRVRYGVRTGEHLYDGEREQQTGLFAALEWRP